MRTGPGVSTLMTCRKKLSTRPPGPGLRRWSRSTASAAVRAARQRRTGWTSWRTLLLPVDKDLASAALAAELKADILVMLTDGDFVGENWGTSSGATFSPLHRRRSAGRPSPKGP